jgi:hypothetical protein
MAAGSDNKNNSKSDSMEQTHLVCAGCEQKITGTYFKVDGKIYCFDCNEKMGAGPAKTARPSWAMGVGIAIVILGLAGLVFYVMAGNIHTVSPMPVANPTPLPAPTVESPAPTPVTNSVPAQPAPSSAEAPSTQPPTPTPIETLSAGAIANLGETPITSETPTPSSTSLPEKAVIANTTPAGNASTPDYLTEGQNAKLAQTPPAPLATPTP